MSTVNPASLALTGYLGYQNAKYEAKKVKDVISDKQYILRDSLNREYISQKTTENIKNLYNEDYNPNSPVLSSMAGKTLTATSNVTNSMYNNKALFGLSQLGGAGLKLAGNVVGNRGLVNTGATISKYAGMGTSVANVVSNINPMYYASNKAASAITGGVTKLLGGSKPGIGTMMASNYAMMLAMPMIQKYMGKASQWLQKDDIETTQIEKMPRMSINPKYKTAEEFTNNSIIQDTFGYIARFQDELSPYEMLNLQLQSQILSNTSALPVLTAEFINQFIRKDIGLRQAYNAGLGNIDTYNQGIMHSATLAEHAYSMRRGETIHSLKGNIGIALGEGAAFLNKFSLLTDIVRQVAIVARGGNIMDEVEKGDLKYNNVKERQAATYARNLGIEENASFASAYFGIQKSASDILASAKSYEEVQVSLMAGIYDASRITALELSTLRTQAYKIAKPINYSSIGAASPVQEEGFLRWMSNKIPLFGLMRTFGAGATNLFRMGSNYIRDNTDWAEQEGIKGKVGRLAGKIADAKVYRYNNKLYNQMAQGFDYRRDTSWGEQAAEAIAAKFNDMLLSSKWTSWMGKANRMSLEEKRKMKFQDTMGQEWSSLIKEAGMEQLSDQAAFYRYGTIDLPKSMDLQTYYLSSISVFTRATMENTAIIAQVNGGQGYRADPPQFQERKLDLYTGKLLTAKEQEKLAQEKINIIAQMAEENARETEKSYSRFFRFFKQDDEKFNREGQALEGTTKERVAEFEKSLKDYLKFRVGERELYSASERAKWSKEINPNFQTIIPKEIARGEELEYNTINPDMGQLNEVKPEFLEEEGERPLLLVDVANISASQWNQIHQMHATYDVNIGMNSFENESKRTFTDVNPIKDFIEQASSGITVPKYDTVSTDLADAQEAIELQKPDQTHNDLVKIQKLLKGSSFVLTEIHKDMIQGFDDVIEGMDDMGGYGSGGGSGFFDEWFGNDKDKNRNKNKTTRKSKGLFNRVKNFAKKGISTTIKYGMTALPFAIDGLGTIAAGVGSTVAGIASAPVLAGAAALAAVGAAGYGAYKLSIDDDSEEIMDKLEESGVIEHNYWGDSEIRDWVTISKLSENEIDALIRFDDWSDEDKKKLVQLKESKESLSKKTAKQFDEVKKYVSKKVADIDTTFKNTDVSKLMSNVKSRTQQEAEVIYHKTSNKATEVYANMKQYATPLTNQAAKEIKEKTNEAINTYQTSALVQNTKNSIDDLKETAKDYVELPSSDDVKSILSKIAEKIEDLKEVTASVGMQNVAATYESAMSGVAPVKSTPIQTVNPPDHS